MEKNVHDRCSVKMDGQKKESTFERNLSGFPMLWATNDAGTLRLKICHFAAQDMIN